MERDGGDATGQTPLKGVVLCCTSLTTDVRTKLADAATQMGAVHKLDLTSDVTHLVVGCITTPKYQYVAKDRPDIKVLAPAWVEAVRDAWMAGGDVDVTALEERHRLAAFSGLHICVTGFDNMEQRGYLSQTVEEQGATYHGDLTKQITHLIAAAPQGAKYSHAKQWGIKVVSLKWFAESLSRGMALDEALYDPVLPPEEQGKGAFRTMPRSRTSLGKRTRHSKVGAVVDDEPGKKKLRRTASTRLDSQSQTMWSELSARDVGQTIAEADRWRDDSAPDTTLENPMSEQEVSRLGTDKAPSDSADVSQGLFSGCQISILGFDDKRAQLLHRFLEPNGGKILHEVSNMQDAPLDTTCKDNYLIVPHANSDLKEPDVPAGTIVVTEWWVERCIHTKQLLDPAVDVLSRPLANVRIPLFSKMIITTTGFDGVNLRHVAKAAMLLGATYQESTDRSVSVIVSGSDTIKKEKAYYAHRHNIPVVSAQWLWSTIDKQRVASFDTYRIQQSAAALAAFGGDATASSPASGEASRPASGNATKGKDDHPPKRLSTIRKRHATPSLPLQASRSPAPTLPRLPPIVHDDDDDDDAPSIDTAELRPSPSNKPSQRRPHPLQEVSPNQSPRKASQQAVEEKRGVEVSSEALGKPSPAESGNSDATLVPLGTTEQTPLYRPGGQLKADLADLLNRQTASRPSSAIGTVPPHRRKSRPLGRAASGVSNRSLSASVQSDHLSQAAGEAVDGYAAAVAEPAPPTTQLGYETADAEAHRLQMSKKKGMRFEDEGGLKRVASVGTVKDSSFSSDAGVGTRVRGRQRAR